jgi:hypothetical protein
LTAAWRTAPLTVAKVLQAGRRLEDLRRTDAPDKQFSLTSSVVSSTSGRDDRIGHGVDEPVVEREMPLQQSVVGRTVEQVEQDIGVC